MAKAYDPIYTDLLNAVKEGRSMDKQAMTYDEFKAKAGEYGSKALDWAKRNQGSVAGAGALGLGGGLLGAALSKDHRLLGFLLGMLGGAGVGATAGHYGIDALDKGPEDRGAVVNAVDDAADAVKGGYEGWKERRADKETGILSDIKGAAKDTYGEWKRLRNVRAGK